MAKPTRNRSLSPGLAGPPIPVVVEDMRPMGSLRFADPSTAEFPRNVNTFNEPFSPRAHGAQNGISTIVDQHVIRIEVDKPGVRSNTGAIAPNGSRYPTDPWRVMNTKRGVADKDNR